MSQEDKQLLLKDLCARLPYGIKVEYIKNNKQYRLHELSEDGNYISLIHETEPVGVCSELGIEYNGEQQIKPYFRSMSSMTEKERLELKEIITKETSCFAKFISVEGHGLSRDGLHMFWKEKEFDWLNAHHFDYRGLIEKGLALEAPKGMYLC